MTLFSDCFPFVDFYSRVVVTYLYFFFEYVFLLSLDNKNTYILLLWISYCLDVNIDLITINYLNHKDFIHH